MVKYVVLLFAAGAVFSPLFLIGIRRYTGQKAKRALGANIASFFVCLILASAAGIGGNDEREQTLNQLLTEMDGSRGGDRRRRRSGRRPQVRGRRPGRGPERHRRRHRRGFLRLRRPGRHLGK